MGQVIFPVGGIRNVLAMSAPLERRVLTLRTSLVAGGAQFGDVTPVVSGKAWLLGVRVWINFGTLVTVKSCGFIVRTTFRESLTFNEGQGEEDVLGVTLTGARADLKAIGQDQWFEWAMARLYQEGMRRFGFAIENDGDTGLYATCAFEIAEV